MPGSPRAHGRVAESVERPEDSHYFGAALGTRFVRYSDLMAIGDVLKRLEESLENMLTLEIVTAVGAVQPTVKDANGDRKLAALADGAKILRTRIDLLQGDITTEMDPAFVTGDYEELRSFHAEREKQAIEIVNSNIEAVKSLIALIQSHGDKARDGAPA